MIIDLRSDTFTKPSEGMLEAMITAEVGDDVFGEDPTTNKLEALSAEIFGMQSGLYCPSGTMTNQIAIKCHTQPGNEIICDQTSHIYLYEGGGIAFNSGCQVKVINGVRGLVTAEEIALSINPDDIHKPKTTLVSLENTANRGGGSCYELTEIHRIKSLCLDNHLTLHLDGARIFNALISKAQSAANYGNLFDSISICLSKGLGAPIGSVLLGSTDFIKQARRIRKIFGGGMRQSGYMAAAGLYALENNITRLSQDHVHAKEIAHALLKKPFIGKMLPVETNILIFEITGSSYSASSFVAYFKLQDVLCLAISPTQVRMVTHLDVTPDMVTKLIKIVDSM